MGEKKTETARWRRRRSRMNSNCGCPIALRAASVMAVVALAFLFISDAAGVLGPGLVGPETPPTTSDDKLVQRYTGETSNDAQEASASPDSQEGGQLPGEDGDLPDGAHTVGEIVSSGGAGTWLGALEIGFSALVAILGGLTALAIMRKRRRLKRDVIR